MLGSLHVRGLGKRARDHDDDDGSRSSNSSCEVGAKAQLVQRMLLSLCLSVPTNGSETKRASSLALARSFVYHRAHVGASVTRPLASLVAIT